MSVKDKKDNSGVFKQKPQAPANFCELPDLSASPQLVAGVDEVGRGALFGPVVAAAVILPRSALPQLALAGVKDSKQLSHTRRLKLSCEIQKLAIAWNIGYATSLEIDQINIFQASLLAMERAVLKLKIQPDLCLIDGRHLLPNFQLPQKAMVKGDERSLEIAAASVVAKVWRDELIVRFAAKYPYYDLLANKGYGTQRHRLAIQEYGPSQQHRKSFNPCR